MALCVYHETVDAVAKCTSCKQDICGKCREFGANGMCGMCVEMASARNANLEASRQARMEAATGSPARTPTGPRPAAAGAKPGTGKPAAPPRPPRPQAPPGMCQEHPDKKATAACGHCKKKVCPYCLDLYDHCAECRQLPSCVRHESMVAKDRCSACKMAFCSVCLDGTDRCDRCRTLGLTGDAEAKPKPKPATKTPTQKLNPPPGRNTSKLPPPGSTPRLGADGAPAPRPPRPPQNPAVKKALASAAYKSPQSQTLPLPLIGGAVAVVAVLGLLFSMAGGKKALPPEEAARHLRTDMVHVQQAAMTLKADKGAYPDSEEMILAAIKAKGVDPEKLPVPIKLVVNAPADEPLEISYRLVGTGFEVRALDAEGRPFAVDGRDVVMTSEAAE